MIYPAASREAFDRGSEFFSGRHPPMFLSAVQIRIRLDPRLKLAGMTDIGLAATDTRETAANEPLPGS